MLRILEISAADDTNQPFTVDIMVGKSGKSNHANIIKDVFESGFDSNFFVSHDVVTFCTLISTTCRQKTSSFWTLKAVFCKLDDRGISPHCTNLKVCNQRLLLQWAQMCVQKSSLSPLGKLAPHVACRLTRQKVCCVTQEPLPTPHLFDFHCSHSCSLPETQLFLAVFA